MQTTRINLSTWYICIYCLPKTHKQTVCILETSFKIYQSFFLCWFSVFLCYVLCIVRFQNEFHCMKNFSLFSHLFEYSNPRGVPNMVRWNWVRSSNFVRRIKFYFDGEQISFVRKNTIRRASNPILINFEYFPPWQTLSNL